MCNFFFHVKIKIVSEWNLRGTPVSLFPNSTVFFGAV